MKFKILFNHPLKGSVVLSLSLTKSYYLTHASQKHWRCLRVTGPNTLYGVYVYNFDNLEGELCLHLSILNDGGLVYYGSFVSPIGATMDHLENDELELTVVSVNK